MADVFSKAKRSRLMSEIRSKNTKPELLLRRELFALGFRYRLHSKALPGKPDIVLVRFKAAVFVNGCFWHGHTGCKFSSFPKSNRIFWRRKILANRRRDLRNFRELKKLGWAPIVVWECEIKKDLSSAANRVRSILRRRGA
jgi:DNA mismatch endonuclease (patch repair protein)